MEKIHYYILEVTIMKKALKTIGMFGAGIGFCIWTYFAYKAGYEECESFTTQLNIHDELVIEKAKLKEKLGIK